MSLTCMLNKVGEMADPCETPAGHGAVKDSDSLESVLICFNFETGFAKVKL